MPSTSSRRLRFALAVAAMLAAALIGYRTYRFHHAAMQAAAVDQQLGRLAEPAPRRAPVSLRPGAR